MLREIWSAVFPALAGRIDVVDFFSHIERVREFCKIGKFVARCAERCVVLPQPDQEQLRQIFERFEGETFGRRRHGVAIGRRRASKATCQKRGLDAYQPAYARYTFCAICEPEDRLGHAAERVLMAQPKSSGGCGRRFSL